MENSPVPNRQKLSQYESGVVANTVKRPSPHRRRQLGHLTDFDPVIVAQHELRMWQFYYRHQFFRLLIELVAFTRYFFGLSMWTAFVPAYYAGRASMVFRLRKGRETEQDYQKISDLLVCMYKVIADITGYKIDYRQVAQLELEWWKVDRYPERYTESRTEAIAAWAAALYGVEQSVCLEYANLRAEAMQIQDSYEFGEAAEIDWQRIGNLLQASYTSLHRSLHEVHSVS